MGTGNRDLYSSFLKVRGTWESSGVPNIELAMMQLIHSRKALETDPIKHAGTTGIPITLEEVFTIKGSNIFNQDKIAEQLTKLKTMVKKPWMEGRLEYTMLPDGTIRGKLCRMCRWKNYNN
jgi:hypothetical protein